MNDLNDFKAVFSEGKEAIVLSHVNPDGDTLSSTLALSLVLEKFFKIKSTPIYMGNYPDIYCFLPHSDKFKNIKDIDKNKTYDVAIAVDVASKDRLFEALPVFQKAKKTINIDHHRTNNNFAQLNFVNPSACSAGNVLYDMFKELEVEIDEDLAILLYTSIMTDTGGFKYENTNAETLRIGADLVSRGANPCTINRACYESKPQAMVQLQAFALANAVFSADGKVAHVIITKDIMNKFNATDDFTDGISEALRQIRTVEIAMVLKENDNQHTKVSLRSKTADISKIATAFGGGGHMFAAGCTIKKPPSVALNKLLDYIKEIL